MKPENPLKKINMLAVIRIRGSVGVPPSVRDTLKMLRLNQVNHCVIVPRTPDFAGMLRKAVNYITWGEIGPKTLEALVEKRARLPGNKRPAKKDTGSIAKNLSAGKGEDIKPVFRLSPPSRGFRSIRSPFPKGDLGNRGEKINELLERMI